MDNKDLTEIKKRYGEKMSHLCRTLFPSLLEKEGLLSHLLLEKFQSSHFLYDDLLTNDLVEEFKNYIYSLVNVENKEKEIITKTPTELLEEAGYNLYECKTEREIQSFKKYYSSQEELCTFRGNRLDRCYVFFAVKKNVDEIKRKNFKNPKRQDAYGTSVISIQFTRDDSHTLSIKNRYNHTVMNPDATFSNDLDNIIVGLTDSFSYTYGLEQKCTTNQLEIPGYVLARDGKYYKYNYEINNIYYGPDNMVIDNFEAKQFEKEKYLILDYFCLDLVHKKIFLLDPELHDSFINSIGKIKTIHILNEGEQKKVIITPEEGLNIEITLDKYNTIIGLKNPNLTQIGDYFLFQNENLTTLDLPNLKLVGNSFLYYNHILISLNLPNLIKVGDNSLKNNEILTTLSLPNLTQVGDYFLFLNENLATLDLPNLTQVGDHFLCNNETLTTLDLPNLKLVGNCFLYNNHSLISLNLPNLIKVGDHFLLQNENLTTLDLPNLTQVEYDFLFYNKKLTTLNLPKLDKKFLINLTNYLIKIYLETMETEKEKGRK